MWQYGDSHAKQPGVLRIAPHAPVAPHTSIATANTFQGPPVAEFLDPMQGLLFAHPYLFLFVGLLFAGEMVLLPAIYLAVTGRLEFAYVVSVAIAATLTSDFAWYFAGRRLPAATLQRLPGRGTTALVKGLDRLFTRKGAQVVFLSKFVYGSRVAAQVLAGVHDMPLRVYLPANALGATSLTLVLSGIAWSVAGAARRYADIVQRVEIAFIGFVAVAAIAYFSAALVVRRRWSQS